MATLYFTVFEGAREVATGDPIQEGAVDIAGTSTQSDPITGTGRVRRRVRVCPDANCFVTWGLNPTATIDGSSGRRMVADGAEYFDIEAGHQIAVIAE